MKLRIYISVSNDLITDQRVQRVAGTLSRSDYSPVIVGRRYRKSPNLLLKGVKIKRFLLLINKGFLFYALLNIRLFFYLISRKGEVVLLANDLDTLPANYLVSIIRGWKLIYDSHEYFTEVPELSNRNFVRKFWLRLEKFLVPRVNLAYTVNDTLAKLYSAKYGLKFHTIRNVPSRVSKVLNYSLPAGISGRKIILYQGAVNKDRGLEEMISLMSELDNTVFIIAGEGDILENLRQKVQEEKLNDSVYFTGRLCPNRLKSLTQKADIGISLERKTNLNYYYALPNKLFDYIQAQIPVVCSNFPEMKRIVDEYSVGVTVKPGNKKILKNVIEDALNNEIKRKKWQKNCIKASEELNWDNEEKKLVSVYSTLKLKFSEKN